jgi:hypothetical protein
MRVEGSSSVSISINVGTFRAPVEPQYEIANDAMKRTKPPRCHADFA